MLAKILLTHHGFFTTVLFDIDHDTGYIDLDNQTTIPGLQNLDLADLMVIFTRFRELPYEQMKFIDEYIQAGKPVVGMRTSTHAFRYARNPDSPFTKHHIRSNQKGWEGGFSRQVLGETKINHYGFHSREGTRGLIDGIKQQGNHTILRGVNDIWGVPICMR